MPHVTLDLVETHFKKRFISNCFPLKKKGAGAGHHTVPISVLWTISSGAMQRTCYTNRPTTFSALRKNITNIFNSLREDPVIFSLVTRNFRRHLKRVEEREGGHIENVII